MNDSTTDLALRAIASAVSRRGSLRALGGASLLGALAGPAAARAGKAGKKAKQLCQRQVGACEAAVREQCEGQQQACLDRLLPCCRFLATCQAGTFLACAINGEP